MATDAIGNPMDGLVGRGDSDLVNELGEPLASAIRRHLIPGECIVWAGRGIPRPARSIPAFPAFFAAFLCGLSGFALMVMFGIWGDRRMASRPDAVPALPGPRGARAAPPPSDWRGAGPIIASGRAASPGVSTS